ncbi:Mor transcription activator family protein [Aneurinibacillus danicus]|uniref:Mor transcription activator family protein n=1 Tax=Aneurinibacillus danicus TaxID=267746 RepID=UPI0014791656|nr:Mor transcription activator family protein [Aneurinibacillus danicus]
MPFDKIKDENRPLNEGVDVTNNIDFSSILHEAQPSDFPYPYNFIAEIAGVESALVLAREISGMYYYFPVYRNATKRLRRRLILKEFDSGSSMKDIARKCDLSETEVRKEIRKMKRAASEKDNIRGG